MIRTSMEIRLTSEHPTNRNLIYRLRQFILGKNSVAILTEIRNTEEQGENYLLNPLEFNIKELNSVNQTVDEENCLTRSILRDESTIIPSIN